VRYNVVESDAGSDELGRGFINKVRSAYTHHVILQQQEVYHERLIALWKNNKV
jgi:hypothetical protein